MTNDFGCDCTICEGDPIYSIRVLKESSSDWYTSIRCASTGRSYTPINLNVYKHYSFISVGGIDDYSVLRDFKTEAEALTCFMQIIGRDDVTLEFLESLDFKFDN